MSIKNLKSELKAMMEFDEEAAHDAGYFDDRNVNAFISGAQWQHAQFAKIAEQYFEALEVIETDRQAQADTIRDLKSLKHSGLLSPGVYDIVQACIERLFLQQKTTFEFMAKVSKETAK